LLHGFSFSCYLCPPGKLRSPRLVYSAWFVFCFSLGPPWCKVRSPPGFGFEFVLPKRAVRLSVSWFVSPDSPPPLGLTLFFGPTSTGPVSGPGPNPYLTPEETPALFFYPFTVLFQLLPSLGVGSVEPVPFIFAHPLVCSAPGRCSVPSLSTQWVFYVPLSPLLFLARIFPRSGHGGTNQPFSVVVEFMCVLFFFLLSPRWFSPFVVLWRPRFFGW